MPKIKLEDGREIELDQDKYSELEKLANEYGKRWRAERGGQYFTLNDEDQFSIIERRDRIDDFLYNSGNYFKTKEEAIHYREVLLAKQRLIDAGACEFSDGTWEIMRSDDSYVFNVFNEFFASDDNYQSLGGIYYPDEQTAQRVIDTMQDDLKLVMGIK